MNAVDLLKNSNNDEKDILELDHYFTYLEGRVRISEQPKYRQQGEFLVLKENGHYLCLTIGRIENLTLPENVGIPNTFVTAHWGNQVNQTRTIYDHYSPTFNQTLYFKIPISGDLNEKKAVQKMHEELKSKPIVTLYLWLDLKNGSNENVGFLRFCIGDLFDSEIQSMEKTFTDLKKRKKVSRICRVAHLKRKVVSSLISSGNTQLNFSFWLMPDSLNEELRQLKEHQGDKIDPFVYKAIKDGTKSELYIQYIQVFAIS